MNNAINLIKDKTKRDIFRFNGINPIAINLDHVISISMENTKISFNFQSNAVSIDLENQELANTTFENVLKLWASDEL